MDIDLGARPFQNPAMSVPRSRRKIATVVLVIAAASTVWLFYVPLVYGLLVWLGWVGRG